MLTKPEVRKAVCRHPIKWDKNQFSNVKENALGKPAKKRLENEASAIDLWNGGLEGVLRPRAQRLRPLPRLPQRERVRARQTPESTESRTSGASRREGSRSSTVAIPPLSCYT